MSHKTSGVRNQGRRIARSAHIATHFEEQYSLRTVLFPPTIICVSVFLLCTFVSLIPAK